MRFACIIALLLPLAAAPLAAAPPAFKAKAAAKACASDRTRFAASGEVRVFRSPREFQPSDLHHAVERRHDNCPVPAIVRRNVGR